MTGLLYFLGIAGTIVLTPILAKLFFNRNKAQDLIEKHKTDENRDSVFMKKYPEADVNRFTKSFTGVGMIVALSMVIAVFLYEKPKTELNYLADVEGIDDFEIEPPPTKRIKPTPPDPPPPEIEVVEPDKIIEDTLVLQPEIEPETVIEPYVPIEPEAPVDPPFFVIVEDMPCFKSVCCDLPDDERKICTEKGIMDYMSKLKPPNISIENGLDDLVYVRFLINKKGEVDEVVALKGIHKINKDAVIAHVEAMPDWAQPGSQRGKAVPVQYVVPLRIKFN